MSLPIRPRHLLFFAALFLLAAVPAYAGTGGSDMPWNGPLTKIQDNLTGPTAKAIAVVLFVIAGAVWGFSNHERGATRLAQAILGAALLLAAPTILDVLGIQGAIL
jgi:type IV secretion system protein VirB2